MALISKGIPAGGLGGGSALLNIVEDLTPQLGGNLDLNGNVITGLEIDIDIQAFDAGLDSIAGLTTAADKMIYTTASDAYAVTDLTTFARTLLDDLTQGAMQTTLDVDPAGTDNSIDVTIAAGLDYISISGQELTLGSVDLATDVTGLLPVVNGGTGSGTASGARTNLGLIIGTDVQAWAAVLDGTTASYTTAEETKLAGIETGAQVNTVDSVFTRTGAVVAAASDYDASQIDNDSNVTGTFVDDALNRLVALPWTLNNVVTKNDFDVSSQATIPSGLFIRDDGLKMYATDFTLSDVFQYSLSTAYDVSTASFDSKSFSFSTQATTTHGVWLSPDGLKMFNITSAAPASIFEYDLGAAFDVSTAVHNAVSLNISGQSTNPRDFFFRADGLRFFVVDQANAKIRQYSMTTAYDLSTASFDTIDFDTSSQTIALGDIFFKDDGLKMFIADVSSGDVFQYTLSTAWNVSTASFDSVSFNTGCVNQSSLFFKKHGATFYVIDSSADKVFAFEVAFQDENPYTDTEKTELNRLSADLLLNTQSSGILNGGIISINADTTKFDFTAGLLYIIDSFTDPEQPIITSVEFTAQSAIAATEVATDNETFVGIRLDNVAPTGGTATALSATVGGVSGTVYITQKPNAEYTREEARDVVQIGALLHAGVVISQVFNLQQLSLSATLQLYDLAEAVGIINTSGNEFSANGANLNINKSAGVIFRIGSNNDGTPAGLKDPNNSAVAVDTAATWKYRHQDGSGGFTVLSDTTVVDPDQFDDGSGTLAVVGNNKHTIKKIYVGPQGDIRLEYGQVIYNSQSEAEEAITVATITDPVLVAETAFRGWLLIKKGATDLTVASDAKFIAAGKFNITTAGSMSGEINTASSVGAGGIAVFKQKVGVSLEFNSIAAESTKIVVTLNAGQNEIRLDVVEANILTSNLNNDANFADDQTGAEIKTVYEAEANAYTDAKDTKLAGIETGAEVNGTVSIVLDVSRDETTAETAATSKYIFRMPFALTLTDVRSSLAVAPTDADFIVDINESGSTILSTKLSIDATEKTSTTAVTPAVISDSALADDAEITIDIDQVGSTVAGAGLKVTLIGTRI